MLIGDPHFARQIPAASTHEPFRVAVTRCNELGNPLQQYLRCTHYLLWRLGHWDF
jgi:hypothetical protein